MLVVLLINQKDYELYNQQTSTNEIRFTLRQDQRAQKNLFMQNKPNFMRFCAKNSYLEKNKPNSNPIKPNFKPNFKADAPKTNPIKPNFKPVPRSGSSILHFDF